MATVAAVIDEGALTFDLSIPCEVFGLDRSDIAAPWYEFLLVGASDRRIRTSTGFVLETAHGPDALDRADTVIVPGWSDPEDEPSTTLCAALVAAYERGARIVSLCTGAFVLGAAGLLDGRRATTHWLYAERLQGRYPGAFVDAAVLYVADGRVLSSAGSAAGIDLCLHLVAEDYGVDVAAAVARRLVTPLFRSGGQAQYIEAPIAFEGADSLARVLDWARARLDVGVSPADMARHAAMSPRTLTRRFAAAVGMPPSEWLQRERLRLAQRLLERSDDPIERVARRAGYDAVSTMRAQFAARLQTSPRAYRHAFRDTRPAAMYQRQTKYRPGR